MIYPSTGPAISRALRDLYEAETLLQLRERLGEHLTALGYWGVGESISPDGFQQGDTWDHSRHVWDNIAVRLGDSRREDFLRACYDAFAAQGEVEENRRLAWLASHKRPHFTITDASVQFEAHRERCRLAGDFGLRAVDRLALPVATDETLPRRLWAMAETRRAQDAAGEVITLLTVYYYMSQMLTMSQRPGVSDSAGSAAGLDPGQIPGQGPAAVVVADTGCDKPVELKAAELEILRWAAAGKTLEDIAMITGLPYRTVRYHMDCARNRYGFATTQQTIVRAALDYGFDPLGG